MGSIVQYEHHGKTVSVDETLKGKHRQHCLCYRCAKFTITKDVPVPLGQYERERSRNCVIANRLFRLVVETGLVTPVYECPKFELKS